MRQVAFKQVDVFTHIPYMGNPLAVVLDGSSLNSAEMQQIAHWTNLSETTFVLPPTLPGADYRLRIFTTARELPFAGHPSIGTAHALLEAGLLAPRHEGWIQQCAAGLLPINVEAAASAMQRIHVRVPKAALSAVDAKRDQQVAIALMKAADEVHNTRIVNVGAVWLIVDLGSAHSVRTLRPDPAALGALTGQWRSTGVTVFGREQGTDAALAVRSFCPGEGTFEDPVCGSGNAAVAAYLHAQGGLAEIGTRYRTSQGREVGRDGYVEVRVHADGAIDIGGAAVTCIDGSIKLP